MVSSNSKTIAACLVTWLALGSGAFAQAEPVRAAADETVEGDSTGPRPAEEYAGPTEAQMMEGGDETDQLAKNGLFVEGLGPGLLYSVNYERLLVDAVAMRIGFSYWSVTASAATSTASAEASAAFFTLPMTVTYVGLRGLEVGGGMTLLHASGAGSTIGASASGSGFAPLGTLLVGYRSHPVGGAGFQFRVGGMAMMGDGLSLSSDDPTGFGVLPWLYLSAGAGF